MLSRMSRFSKLSMPVRRLSMFDKIMNDPKVQERAASMMQDPEAMNKAMANLSSALKDGGGGMTGMLLRNSPIKGMVDKMGGVENLERMMKDPQVMGMIQNMMKDPAAVAKAQANMEEMMKQQDQLPDSKKN